MIPKIIHYCWFGKEPLPKEYAGYIKEWQKLNPGFKIMKWDESNIPTDLPYIKTALSEKNWANASNLARFIALQKYGGIYMDTDMKLIKPLKSLLDKECFLGFQEGAEDSPYFKVNNAIMGAVPNHKFVKLCADTIVKQFDGKEEAHLSSPDIVTALLEKNYRLKVYGLQKLGDITLYPKEVFYPIHYNEAYKVKEYTKYITNDTIGVHIWARTWFTKEFMLDLIDSTHKDNKELQQLIESARKEYEIQKTQIISYTDKIAAAEDEINRNNARIIELEQFAEYLKNRLVESENQNQNQKDIIATYPEKLASFEASIQSKEARIAELNKFIQDIEKKLDDSGKVNESQKTEITSYLQRIAALDINVAVNKTELLNLTSFNEDLKGKLVELEKSHQMRNAEIVSYQEKIAIADVEVNLHKNRIIDLNRFIEYLKEQLTKSENDLTALQATNAGLYEKQLHQLNQIIEKDQGIVKLSLTIKALESEIIDKDKLIEENKLNTDANNNTIGILKKEILASNTEIENLKQSFQLESNKCNTLSGEMIVLNQDRIQYKKEIERSVKDFEKMLHENKVQQDEYEKKISWYTHHYENKNFFQLIKVIFELKVLKRNKFKIQK